jgi:hypothetical protein
MNKFFAVFVVAPIGNGFATTTRPNSSKIGLAGGKVDLGETAREAVIREAKEEGFTVIGVEENPFYYQEVDGKMVAWFRATEAVMLYDFKEKGRITPVVSSLQEISLSGFGNDNAIKHY